MQSCSDDASYQPPAKARGCSDPNCTGVHSSSHGHSRSELCPSARLAERARQRAVRARRRAEDAAYRERDAAQLARFQARKATQALLPPLLPEERCAYPGCVLPRRDGIELCAKFHSATWSPNGGPPDAGLCENDGIIDWLAVQIAAAGERPVRLTWVERDIAIAMALAAGCSYYQAALRTGVPVTGETDSRLRGAKFRRLLTMGRRYFADPSRNAGAA